MKQLYYLNGSNVPTIPVLHDCVVKDVTIENQFLVFTFEDDITYHDGIKYINPDAKSIIMKFHLIGDISDIELHVQRKPNRFSKKYSYYTIDLSKNIKYLKKLTEFDLEYLYHYVGFNSIIIKMWSSNYVVFDINADYVEFNWIDKRG